MGHYRRAPVYVRSCKIPTISLLQIRYFVAVFEEGGFSQAAGRENCAQPGLSVHIRNLEDSLGEPLFERSVNGVTPTPAGQRFYRHAVSILRSVRAAELDISEMSDQVSGLVRAGLIPSAARGLLPSMLPGFVDAYPRIDLRLVQAYSGTLIDWLLSGELDFVLVDEPSVGLAPILVSRMIAKIKELKEQRQLTVLMAEQNFNQAVKIADRGYIIVHGEIEFEGKSTAELLNNDMIKQYYLGA